jgi:hypothetical protein
MIDRVKIRFPIIPGRIYYTGDGREIRIYTTDGGGHYPVHGGIWTTKYGPGYWEPQSWTLEGRKVIGDITDDDIKYEKTGEAKEGMKLYREDIVVKKTGDEIVVTEKEDATPILSLPSCVEKHTEQIIKQVIDLVNSAYESGVKIGEWHKQKEVKAVLGIREA